MAEEVQRGIIAFLTKYIYIIIIFSYRQGFLMNWYKRIILAKAIWYGDEEMQRHIDSLVEEENKNLSFWEKLELKEKLLNVLATYPPGFSIKKTEDGWTVYDPNGNAVSVNESELANSIGGGKARFDFMDISI